MSLPSRLLGANPSIQVSTLLSGSLSTPSAKQAFIPPANPVFDSISTYTVASTVAEITLSSIPSTYKHLQVRMNVFSNSFGSVFMRINSDSNASNYQSSGMWGQQNNASGQVSGILSGRPAILPNVGAGQLGTTYPYLLIIDILDYKDTNKVKTIRSFHGVSTNSTHYNDTVGLAGGIWNSTSAINTLMFYLDGGNDYRVYSKIALYGIKES